MIRPLLLSFLFALAWGAASAGPPDLPAPRPLSMAPQQAPLAKPTTWRGSVGTASARLQGRASFQAEVQILGMATYRDGWEGQLAPVDLAVGWGPMGERDALDGVAITQADRFYYWKIPPEGPWTAREVALHSANIHIVPATPAVLAQIRGLRPGDKVVLEGALVDAWRPDGRVWETSLTRSDTGPGACEILLLHTVRAVPAR